jgi:AcrR family transcriptional regulator
MGELRRASEVRQVELTDAALHIIATKGITALSTRSLAAQIGLSSGAIFRHFASLEALLDAVVARVEAVLAATYPPKNLGARARLEHFVEARSTAVGNQVGILRLVVSEQFRMALPKGGSARLASCVRATREFVLACLREGQDANEFRDDLDADVLATVVMGTIQILALSTTASRQGAADAQTVRAGLLVLLAQPLPQRSKSKKKVP